MCVYIYKEYIYSFSDICYIHILFQVVFPYRLLQNIEYSSLYYTVGGNILSSCI